MILNDNSTQQINTLVIQLQNKITNLSNELKSLNKEISDLEKKVSSNTNEAVNDAAAMNAKIKANTEAISGKADKSHTHSKSEITDFDHNHDDRYYTESEVDAKLNGKADKSHTHIKSEITDFPTSLKNPNALTINGKTYDGSEAVDAGVQTVANGGTGVTTQADINKAFVGDLEEVTSDVTDGTEFVSSYASDNGFAETIDGALNKPYKRKFSAVWGYIKGKISSVLDLTKDNYGGKASTAGTADKTVNDITIDIPYVGESGQYVIPLGNIPQPESTEINSPYNWDITGFFSIIRPRGHAGAHITFEAGHGYSHSFTTYAYLDEDNFTEVGHVGMSIKAFKYDGNWWLGLWINTQWQGYYGKMTITYSRGLTAEPTCILYNSVSNGVANKEIYDSIQDIPSWWWRRRTIHNPTIFTQYVTAPGIQANSKMVIPIGAPSSLGDGCIWIER